jgi:hypothetical protein
MLVRQTQKKFIINHSLVLIDGLIQRSINGSRPSPPADAQDGKCYRITAPADHNWQDREDQLALSVAGDWHFIIPSIENQAL